MTAPRKLRRFLTIAAVLAAALVTAVPAYAVTGGGGGGGASGDGKGNFYAWVKSQVHISGSGYKSGDSPNVPFDYDPPHCWYEPEYTYDEMRDWAQRIHYVWIHQGAEEQQAGAQWYKDTLEQIKPYADEPGKIFWFLTDDGTEAGWDCYINTNPFWIHVGEQPPADPGDKLVDPVDLARIARANLTLPKPEFTLNPPAQGGVYRSYVGLETVVTVPSPGDLEVTAEIPGVPYLTATVTAKPVSVTITSDGPSSSHDLQKCPAYTAGMKLDGTCYITFSHASTGGPYTITVTQRWEITSQPVANMGQNPFPMDSDPVTIYVDEIQSAVTG
jgi:hypothetical protein